MDVDALEWLSAAANAGSLSAVATHAGVAVSTVARRIETLEAQLRLRLLDRRPGGVTPTADGVRILALAEPMLTAADRIRRQADALRAGGARPSVSVSATEFVTAEILAPALPRLAASGSHVRVTLRSQTRTVSLAARDADLAIRLSPPEGASLVARKLPVQPLALFASAGYLDGGPQPPDLHDARILTYDDSYGPIAEATWAERAGFGAQVVATSSSTHALIAAVRSGAGIALLPTRFARRAGLTEIPVPFALPARTPYLIVHRDLRRVREIATVHRWIVDTFARDSRD